ncbi:alpha/beta hydrolase [Actinoplanes bogorensis]|uniref:Alpha/beta hydrolase n=1 Tax=Paractinoplanes bogorensis TaxID=1610840 RepID=A0ABS5YWZ1_9ACTN|nr:alpha/beta hydrolase [Actinoplanes bogorensis]MBU2667957.1 alpha/beta hydrolase [Actinoplanes bogorensis]
MPTPLPRADNFAAYTTVRLDRRGALLNGRDPVPPAQVASWLAGHLSVPAAITDIVVFVHGWQNSHRRASASSRRLFAGLWSGYSPDRYPRLSPFRPMFVSVQWPSRSDPLPAGYKRIRDRAHAMTTTGYAAHVIAALLGYLDASRNRPHGPDTLRTSGGQYLHCVGHSFGCRFLGEAISYAADPPDAPTLGWPWHSREPFSVDTFLGLQMAARPDIFQEQFRALVDGTAPISGPVVLTVSPHDKALATWHPFTEKVRGLGAVGADGAPTVPLRATAETYASTDFQRLTNVDASWRYGGHSDFWYPETIHLMLSLMELGR